MDERIDKYFQGELKKPERVKLLLEVVRDEELRKQIVEFQNVYTLTGLAPQGADKEAGQQSLQQFMKRQRRMVRRKYLIRSLGYAAAAAILIVSVWITAVSYVDKPDDYVAAQQEFFVPAGQRARIKLPDGTFVWLNAGSVLTYPSIFGEERKVYLKGEGFFDVAKNEKSPFIVSTGTLDIRALGTQFNVKAYGGEEAVATLVHGKVEVARGQEAVVLQPGEQCRIAAGEAHALIVGKADLMSTLAWKNGEFVFKDASLEQVIDELARWYNVEMMYDHSLFRESRVHIYMNRSQTLDEALDMLSKAWNIRYERQGTKVWLGERHTGGTDSD